METKYSSWITVFLIILINSSKTLSFSPESSFSVSFLPSPHAYIEKCIPIRLCQTAMDLIAKHRVLPVNIKSRLLDLRCNESSKEIFIRCNEHELESFFLTPGSIIPQDDGQEDTSISLSDCIPFKECQPAIDLLKKYPVVPTKIKEHLLNLRCNNMEEEVHILCDMVQEDIPKSAALVLKNDNNNNEIIESTRGSSSIEASKTRKNCVPLTKCTPVKNFLLKYHPIPPQVKHLLLKQRCNENADGIYIQCDLSSFGALIAHISNKIRSTEVKESSSPSEKVNDKAMLSCARPNGTIVSCIPFAECSAAMNMIQKYKTAMPEEKRNQLKKLRCGTKIDKVNICCDLLETEGDVKVLSEPSIVHTEERSNVPNDLDKFLPGLNIKGLNILNNLKCGKSSINRMSYGEEVNIMEFPWMALLHYNGTRKPFKCGGTLITNQFVLTAAHCVVDVAFNLTGVRLGEHDTNTTEDCQIRGHKTLCAPNVEDYGIEKTIPHPRYNREYLTYDVALIKLDRPVIFKNHIQPICLPITKKCVEPQIEPKKYFIAGWGTTETGEHATKLLKATVPHRDLRVCQRVFKDKQLSVHHICAGGENGVDACKGDSGGPLFASSSYKLTPRFVQYGIVSFGDIRCGREKVLPGVYSNVVKYMPWITSSLE